VTHTKVEISFYALRHWIECFKHQVIL